MAEETLDIVGRELMPLDQFVKGSNKVCRQLLDGLEKEES